MRVSKRLEDMKLIKSKVSSAKSCYRLGDALVFDLKFTEAET